MLNRSRVNKDVKKTLRKRYILALSILAFLIILSQCAIQFAISRGEDDSRIVNIAGRQRMLSQRINKAVLGIYAAEVGSTRSSYLEELKFCVDLWQKSHIGLKEGNKEMGLPGKNSDIVKQMFVNIEQNHQGILQAAYKVIAMEEGKVYTKEKMYSEVQKIKEHEGIFLKGMDAIVFQYDAESKEKIKAIKYMEIALLIVTFFVILMEVKFIFLPAEKEIEKAFSELEDSYTNLQKLFETAPAAMFIIDDNNLRVLELNKLAAESVDHGKKDAIKELRIDTILKNAIEDEYNSKNSIINRIRYEETLTNEEAILQTTSYGEIPVIVSSNKLIIDDRQAILIGISDISKQKETERILKHFATIDGMTGLVNKRHGLSMLESLFLKAKEEEAELSICFMDVDGLKKVNDEYGHDEGDWYIKSIAKIILQNVGTKGYAFRYGGDEIVIVWKSCNKEMAFNFISKIDEALRNLAVEEKKGYKMSISSGIIEYKSAQAKDIDEFIKKADQIMYENKKRKKV